MEGSLISYLPDDVVINHIFSKVLDSTSPKVWKEGNLLLFGNLEMSQLTNSAIKNLL